MDEIVEMKLKNHSQYNKKILFFYVKASRLEYDRKVMEETIQSYKKMLEENKDLSIIFDVRQLGYVNPKMAWEGASLVCKLNNLATQNVLCSCIIMENETIRKLFNMVTKVHPIIVPFKMIKNNQEALDFVISKMKN